MTDRPLTLEEKHTLLEVVRTTILEHLQKGTTANLPATSQGLSSLSGAFVSLHKQGMLRGCIGTFVGRRPLINTVQEMAISSSQHDPRFPPVQESEMNDMDIEISVLSPLREIEDVSEIRVGRHGIYITRGARSGVLLPQVASEHGWDRQTFLEHTCLKAGLPPDAWKKEDTKIEIFEAEIFSDRDQ